MPNSNRPRELLSQNLKRLRAQNGLSQLALAHELGVAANFVNAIERGQKWVSPDTLVKLCAFFKVEPFELFLPETSFKDLEGYRIKSLIGELEREQKAFLARIRSTYSPEDEE